MPAHSADGNRTKATTSKIAINAAAVLIHSGSGRRMSFWRQGSQTGSCETAESGWPPQSLQTAFSPKGSGGGTLDPGSETSAMRIQYQTCCAWEILSWRQLNHELPGVASDIQANGLPQASPGQARNERRPGSEINGMRQP